MASSELQTLVEKALRENTVRVRNETIEEICHLLEIFFQDYMQKELVDKIKLLKMENKTTHH